jgi:predicted DsbA family dithiol-disulfide isomerase
MLNPRIPTPEGYKYVDYFRAKGMTNFTLDTARQWHARLAPAGLDLPTPVRFLPPAEDKRIFNTRQSHRLSEWVLEQYGASANVELTEKMMRAYFEDGSNIHETDVLCAIAATVDGVDAGAARAMLDDPTAAPTPGDIDRMDRWAKGPDIDCHGVPLFLVGGVYKLSGAQPAETLLRAFAAVARETA